MTFPFATRELIVAARRQVLTRAIALYVGLLAAFTLVWAEKLPALTGTTFYESFRVAQASLLIVLLPWVALRCSAADRQDDVVVLAALTARRPSAIVLAKVASIWAMVSLVAVAGVPVAIVAGKISAVPSSLIILDVSSLIVLASLAAGASAVMTIGGAGPLSAWLSSSAIVTMLVVVAGRLAETQFVQDALLAAIAIGCGAALAMWSDRSLQYCHD